MKTQQQKFGIRVRRPWRAAACGIAVAVALSGVLANAHAGDLERKQARRIHDRIAGVPPTDAVLNAMEAMIVADGNGLRAAQEAMKNPNFYSVTLKNFATPWTNRDQTVFAPLNDYTATVIGMVRDDEPFNTLLSADILYTGNGVSPAYSPANNDHYAAMEDQNVNLMTALAKQSQSSLTGVPAAATAGILTSRAASEAFFIAGTNRAMFRFTMLNHMCRDMEQVHDTTRPPDRIRQDVSRSPGGDSRIFLNNCIGCHSGMDPMAQAFAYYNYDETSGRLVYTANTVQPKYLINSDNFKPGFVTPNDSWENRWRAGPNSLLGWSSTLPGKGAGAKSLGDELGNSKAFAKCQVEKVFRAVCFRSPANSVEDGKVDTFTTTFMTQGYKLKQVFADVADLCKGD